MLLLALATASSAALPIANNCQVDPGGANDAGTIDDLNSYCVDVDASTPWITAFVVSVDEVRLSGSSTSDSCTLFDTDNDFLVDLAACITLRSSGIAGDNLTEFDQLRLFTCDDQGANACTSAQLLPGAYASQCEVAHPETDPFGPATPGGLGDEYPFDTQVACALDLRDFTLAPPAARLIDACSYPAHTPDSAPADCILYSTCTGASDCDDGNECSIDTCSGGTCRHTASAGSPCTDGLFCNAEETCNELGFCQANTAPLNCDDGWACTIDWCDELADTCVNDPRDSLCSDGDLCNGVETCQPIVAGARAGRAPDEACAAGFAPDCDDNIPCTLDTCDAATGACNHAPNDAACDDGSACNGLETCDPNAGCSAGTASSCDDGIACTTDACVEASGACSHTPVAATCSDGLFCNGAEACDPNAGCSAGSAPDCNDGVACTIDACDESADACGHQADHGACSDGLFCDGVETCDPNAGCRPGDVPCSGPAACSEASDACVGCISDADCSNGVYCDGVETCETSTGTCRSGEVASCIDAVGCTIDSCDEVGDRCVHDPNAAACDDGLFCNGAETCDPTGGCLAGAAPSCSDGIGCTTDSCVEATDSCNHAPVDAACDNGRFCDGVEACDPMIGCDSGPPVSCPGDNLNCSIETCNEATDSCGHDYSRCTCGDHELVAPEECDPPTRAGTFEDCNNAIDDDGDALVDCADPECLPGGGRAGICDENCRVDQLCKRVESDPAAILFNTRGGPSSFWVHGRFALKGDPDPVSDGFQIRISNESRPIYSASLGTGDLVGDDAGLRFAWADKTARYLGDASARGGLGRVQLRIRDYGGVRYLTFRVQAWGDFSAATERTMRTEVEVGNEVASLTAQWTPTPKSWLLHQHEF